MEFFAAATPLETMLRNLISNAVKHHDRDDGIISISVRDSGKFIEFSVADDGPGIPPHAQERIFKLFQTASVSERRNSGVGLAVSKRLVDTHGGWIVVESQEGQRGTCFRFFWPNNLPNKEVK